MKVPLKFETRPSPAEYNIKSTIDLNRHRAFFIGSPTKVRVDGVDGIPFTDLLGETMRSRKELAAERRDPFGPGSFEAASQGQLSHSPLPPMVKFGSAIQRDDSFLAVGDPNINVCPARYDETKFIEPCSNHINLEKKLVFGQRRKEFNPRKVG